MNKQLSMGFILCLIMSVALVMSACTKQQALSSEADPADVYSLISVDGNDMPASVSHGDVALEVLSGTFIINADGTCSSKTVFVPPTGSEVTREVAATYTMDGSELTMKWEGAGITVGTIEGDTFTMNNEGMIFVYKK